MSEVLISHLGGMVKDIKTDGSWSKVIVWQVDCPKAEKVVVTSQNRLVEGVQ